MARELHCERLFIDEQSAFIICPAKSRPGPTLSVFYATNGGLGQVLNVLDKSEKKCIDKTWFVDTLPPLPRVPTLQFVYWVRSCELV